MRSDRYKPCQATKVARANVSKDEVSPLTRLILANYERVLFTAQQHNFFKTHGKVTNIIVNNDSSDNLIFVRAVEALKLATMAHEQPY